MTPILAWLPFLVALTVAFASGVAFARVCHGRAVTWPRLRRSGPSAGQENPTENPAIALLALCLVLIPIATFAAVLLLHVR